MPDNEEAVLFEQSNIKVTNLRVIIGPKSYALSNISSAALGHREQVNCFVLFLMFLGVMLATTGITQITYNPRMSIGVFVLGAIIAAACFALVKTARPIYTVKIRSSSGKSNILESKDIQQIQPIVSAINRAIVRRG